MVLLFNRIKRVQIQKRQSDEWQLDSDLFLRVSLAFLYFFDLWSTYAKGLFWSRDLKRLYRRKKWVKIEGAATFNPFVICLVNKMYIKVCLGLTKGMVVEYIWKLILNLHWFEIDHASRIIHRFKKMHWITKPCRKVIISSK